MSKYNLLIDCSFVNDKHFFPTSLALYAGRLLQGFKDSEVFNVSAIVYRGMEDVINNLSGFKVEAILVDEHTRVTPWRIVDRVLGLIPFKAELEKRHIDVSISPWAFGCYFFFSRKYRHHLIVQDMAPYYIQKERLNPALFGLWCFYRRLLNRNVRGFVSISQKTKEEFMRFDGRESVVVYNSLPLDFPEQEKAVAAVADKRYILDVNRFHKYKNAETLIKAFYLIKDRISHILYLKGDDRHPEDCLQLGQLVADLGLTDRVVFDRANRTESEMRFLYTHADLFVSPSLMEGFGWTPIEAAILKVPVLISNIDVMREISCGRLSTFDPYSAEDLASHIEIILNNPPDDNTRAELSDFFLNKYSLKAQIDGLTKVLLKSLSN